MADRYSTQRETFPRISALVDYDLITGIVTRKNGVRGSSAGAQLGTLHEDGYLVCMIDRVPSVKLHDLAWFKIFRALPPPGHVVAHANKLRSDNRAANLVMLTVAPSSKIRDLVVYDPIAGLFSWRYEANVVGKRFSDAPGWTTAEGYLRLGAGTEEIQAHRLAYEMMTGNPVPEDHDIDHANGIRADNRWANLRLVTRTQNLMNTMVKSNNTSGHRGISFDKARGLWAAEIKANGERRRLGRFATLEQAVAARVAAESDMFGEHSFLKRSPTA